MKNSTKIWLITATSLILIGFIIMGGALALFKWDFEKLSTDKFETDKHEIAEDFNSISVKADTANIAFALSDDGKCKVECYENKKEKHSVKVEEDTLIIEKTNNKAWYDYIGINFSTPKITVYLPKTEYSSLLIKASTGDVEMPEDFKFESADISLSTGVVDFFASATDAVKIKTTTGRICAQNISVGALTLSTSTGSITASNIVCDGNIYTEVSTGKTNLNNIKCKNITSDGDTGKITLSNVIAEEKLSIERNTGDVRFENSDAGEIFVETSTGNVTGTLLTEKVFITESSTGKINVPKTTSTSRCEITTSTGDIKISVNS